MSYEFTTDWFNATAKSNWDALVPQIQPQRILEIGSFEGASTCYLIEKNDWTPSLEIYCVDTWTGGIEHQNNRFDMAVVEERFKHNIEVAKKSSSQNCDLMVLKGKSDKQLANLIAMGMENSFDLIYIDGSHQAPDVLMDALLSFKLVRPGGYLFFDDYLWSENLAYGQDPIRSPKFAIDCFTNTFCRQIQILRGLPIYQLYIQKTSDC